MTVLESAQDVDTSAYDARIMDVDSHEALPAHLWADTFGPNAARLAELIVDYPSLQTPHQPDVHEDAMEISHRTVWEEKGFKAPGALDLARRADVLDEQGISRQLVFPNMALFGMLLIHNPEAPRALRFDPTGVDRMAIARGLFREHNDWAGRVAASPTGSRTRVVGVAYGDDLDDLVANAEAAIGAGVRALWLAGGVPLAGMSPGNRALDPFWEIMERSNTALVLHVGTEFAFLSTNVWGQGVAEFKSSRKSSAEFPIDPYHGATLHHVQENYLATMVLSGVFERFPNLRFGVIECSAHWVGPFAEQLDIWATEFHSRVSETLTMLPSEYLARNVRVTPFVFEPIARYYERYPSMASVYCYSSDFPHREGGAYSKRTFAAQLEPLGQDVLEQFFVRNGAFLLPD